MGLQLSPYNAPNLLKNHMCYTSLKAWGREMIVHKTIEIPTLYNYSQLLLSDALKHQFYAYLKRLPQKYICESRLDYPSWYGQAFNKTHIIESLLPHMDVKSYSRRPLDIFAYRLCLDFVNTYNVSMKIQIMQQLFSGNYRKHLFRMTPNAFPLYAANDIQHHVVWFNPKWEHDQDSTDQVARVIQLYYAQRNQNCLIFQNPVHNRTIPQVPHLQLFVQR